MKSGEPETKSKKQDTNLGHAGIAVEDALLPYARFLDERSGIFAALREYELPWESPIHVCTGELKPEFCKAAAGARPAISSTVCGSGASAAEAKMRCLYEALERHSGIFRGDEPRRTARYTKIAAEAPHPDALLLFSDSQYNQREEWNQREGDHNWVPARFDAERSIEWSPARSLTLRKTKYLPTAYCYFGYPFDSLHDFCRPDSNGNAAGNSLEEAVVHGFLEVVERECGSVWWYNRVHRPRVEVESFDSPCITPTQSLFRMIGRSVEVLDITVDRAIPAFVAVSRSQETSRTDYAVGFGAHFDAQVALTRALTEMTQFLPVLLSDRDPGCFICSAKGRPAMSFLSPDERLAPLRSSDFPAPTALEPQQEVRACAELARSWGLEMLVLDQTREDIGMPVVKVVVPGMRSWWARFASGRLYTLPVQLGWLREPKTESDLNPCHLIL